MIHQTSVLPENNYQTEVCLILMDSVLLRSLLLSQSTAELALQSKAMSMSVQIFWKFQLSHSCYGWSLFWDHHFFSDPWTIYFVVTLVGRMRLTITPKLNHKNRLSVIMMMMIVMMMMITTRFKEVSERGGDRNQAVDAALPCPCFPSIRNHQRKWGVNKIQIDF